MKQPEDTFPCITPVLLEALDNAFPKTDFGPNKSLRDLDYHYGQRSVVRFLANKLADQAENSLTSNI
jgi:hypothetical protein